MGGRVLKGYLRIGSSSIRLQVMLAAVGLVILCSVFMSWFAYRAAHDTIVSEALRAVNIAASAREMTLVRALNGRKVRAVTFLDITETSCGLNRKRAAERACLQAALRQFMAINEVRSARLVVPGQAPIVLGQGGDRLEQGPLAGQQVIASFHRENEQVSVLIRAVSGEGGGQELLAEISAVAINEIFADRYGLGELGETYLTDAKGFILTPVRYERESWESGPNTARPVRRCLLGEDGAVVDLDYRGVPMIQGFRYVEEIGGGCVKANMDLTEALVPAKRILRYVVLATTLFAVLAIAIAFALARSITRPIVLLAGRAGALQAGKYESDVPVEGPAEIRKLARAFSSMSRTLVADIERRKRTEQALQRAREELEERVEERTAELRATNRELEAFAYSVSHDLRSPLRGIDGFSQVLLSKYAPQLDEKGREYLDRIRAAAQRMGQLIDDLLKLSRFTRVEMKRVPFDLSALARQTAHQLAAAEPERVVDVGVENGLEATGDPTLLAAVMENLIGNAWKFTSRVPKARIDVGGRKVDGTCVYFVRDNGAGFNMEFADQLFGVFQRLHKASEFPGTGIGLASVRRIIARHGGEIWAESEQGKGATFYFTIGQARPSAGVAAA